MDAALADRLLEWVRRDRETRTRLAEVGTLFDGYHPEMQAVHDANADRLERVVAEIGWPSAERVGDEAAEAAWLIVQHAIARPDFQRAMLETLEAEVRAGRVPAWQPAYLRDRIAVQEGRLQTYGTQFDWDDDGRMRPLPIADAEGVEARRAAVGLSPLAAAVERVRGDAAKELPPPDLERRRAEQHAWAVRVGWRPGKLTA